MIVSKIGSYKLPSFSLFQLKSIGKMTQDQTGYFDPLDLRYIGLSFQITWDDGKMKLATGMIIFYIDLRKGKEKQVF